MKIAITGHTDGIGKAIAEACEAAGHEVVGFSRATGYHLFKDMKLVADAAEDCDVFVNNRYTYFDTGQLEMLYQMFELWKGEDKRIINIGSRAGTYPCRGMVDRYAVHKKALDAACDQLNGVPSMRPRVTNIKPGYVDTASVKNNNALKLKPETIAEAVVWTLSQPRAVHISTIALAHMPY